MNAEPITETADPSAPLTAWALDEMTPDERAAFEQQMESDAGLAAMADQTREFCGLLTDSPRQSTPELQQAARARLLFEADKPKRDSAAARKKWIRRVTAAAACLAAGSAGTHYWMGTTGRLESKYAAKTKFYVPQSSAADAFDAVDGNRRDPGNAESAAAAAPVVLTGPERAKAAQQSGASARNVPGVRLASATAAPSDLLPDAAPVVVSAPALDYSAPMSGAGLASGSGRGSGRGVGAGGGVGAGFGAGRGAEYAGASKPVSPPAAYFAAQGDTDGESAREFRARPIESQMTPGSEGYKGLPENPFRGVEKEPLSTFSIDVDTASYSNVRRFLNQNQAPPPEAVRLEELVNYFPYDYAPPVDGKPFAVHVEMTSAPWDAHHRIARIALKGKEIAQNERPAANLVFLVDVSGSMQPENKLPLVKQSLKFVVDRLTEKDTVSLVTYAGETGVALPATNGADKARIMAAIDGLGAGGSTNGAGGITTAYAQAAQHFQKEGINRVIIATDGDFNVGVTSHGDLLNLITDKAKTGVFLSVLGYGMGNVKDDTLELLADKGNGNYAYIDSLSEARKSLADQFNGTLVTIAKDVKIQIEFNPAVIRSYRLLGYENRMLAKEDFNDDKKDAGEIGAGHTVTALYELVPVNAPEPQAGTVDGLKYQPKPADSAPVPPPAPGAGSDETMTVKFRWKAPDAGVSQLMEVPVKDAGGGIADASGETRWAVAVAGFAALLNNSQFNGLTWEDVRALAKAGKGNDPNGYRGEFLQLINRAEAVRR